MKAIRFGFVFGSTYLFAVLSAVQGQDKPNEPKKDTVKIVLEKEYGEKAWGYSCLAINATELLACTEGHSLEIVDMKTFQARKRFDKVGDKGAFVLGNKFVLAADAFKDGIALIDIASGKPTAKIDASGNFICHSGLNLLASRNSSEQVRKTQSFSVLIYDVVKQTVVKEWTATKSDHPSAMAFSKSGILGIHPFDNKTFLLWWPPYDKAPVRVECGKSVRCMGFSPDERHLALGIRDEERVEVWDVQTKARLQLLVDNGEGRVYALAYSPDGQFLAALGVGRMGYQVTLWRTKDYTQIGQFSAHKEIATQLVFFSDNKRFATAAADGLIKVWRIEPDAVGK